MFVICMEALSQLLNKAAATGRIKYHPLCVKIALTHLCFVGDLIVFSEASTSSLQGFKEVMEEF